MRNFYLKIILIIILLGIAGYSGVKVGTYLYGGYINNKINESLRAEYYNSDSPSNNPGGENGSAVGSAGLDEDRTDKFRRLRDISADIVGWIKIEGTKIDYPVVKGSDNVFYLNRNIKRDWAVRGAIFMDYRNTGGSGDLNTLIYGHHMKDGSMFGGLAKYKEESYYAEHPYIILDYPGKTTKWQIFSVYVSRSEDGLVQTDFDDDEEFADYVLNSAARSMYDTKVEVTGDEPILTLLTCTYEFDDARLVLHAKQIFK